jgi:hypothetical protein
MPEGSIAVILCIDCEPDQPVWAVDQPSPWSGFERLANNSGRFRDRLEQATGKPALFSWALRMDPQIEMAYGASSYLPERFARFFAAIDAIGDSSGVHPHAWRWDAQHTTWVADHEDACWISTCLGTAYESYREAFGRTPLFHRFGSAFMSTEIMNEVRATGSGFDLTLEPGEPSTPAGLRDGVLWRGDLPDYTAIPRVPYRPDRSDFRRVDEDCEAGLITVPLSAGRYVPPGTPTARQLATRRLSRPVRSARGAARRLRRHPPQNRRPPDRLLAMWRPWRSPTDFWNSAFAAVEELEAPLLSFAIRSDLGLPGGAGDEFDAIIAALQHDRRAERLRFTTLDRVSVPLARGAALPKA